MRRSRIRPVGRGVSRRRSGGFRQIPRAEFGRQPAGGRLHQFGAALQHLVGHAPDRAGNAERADNFAGEIIDRHRDAADFRIETHGQPGLVCLYGIESPGLTSSLAITFPFNIVLGILVAYLSNWLIGAGSTGAAADVAWRWMLGIQALPSALYLLASLALPESPVWLAARGSSAGHPCRMKVTYYLEVISSWCYWAEPAWAGLKRFSATTQKRKSTLNSASAATSERLSARLV